MQEENAETERSPNVVNPWALGILTKNIPIARADTPVCLPAVLISAPLGASGSHPDHALAKAGDVQASLRLVQDVMPDLFVAQVTDIARSLQARGEVLTLVPVIAEESTGRNKVPLAMAKMLEYRIRAAGVQVEVCLDVVQASAPKRTMMDGLDRIFNSPAFAGPNLPGACIMMIDDTVTQGATFASLLSFLNQAGASVVGCCALTGKQYSAMLSLSPLPIQKLRECHGDLETTFRDATGYGYDALTESESRYLANFKPAQAVRDRIIEAGRQARERSSRSLACAEEWGSGDDRPCESGLTPYQDDAINTTRSRISSRPKDI